MPRSAAPTSASSLAREYLRTQSAPVRAGQDHLSDLSWQRGPETRNPEDDCGDAINATPCECEALALP